MSPFFWLMVYNGEVGNNRRDFWHWYIVNKVYNMYMAEWRSCAACIQGTAGQEVEAVSDLSALVNYIEPIRFHSFDHANSKSVGHTYLHTY